jgi:hypothetical protein
MVPRLGYQLDGFAATVTHIATAKYLRVREHALGLFLEAGWGGLLWCHQCTGLSGRPLRHPFLSSHWPIASGRQIETEAAPSRLRRRRVGGSARFPPPLCRCLESAAPAGGSNCSDAAGAKVQNSKWRPAMRRGVSPCLPTWSAELARSRFVGPSLVCHEPEAGSWLA